LEEEKSYENFSKLTLEEILKSYSFSNKEEAMMQTIYYKQYEEAELDTKERQEIYLQVKQIIHENI
jgi:hypothetical protein